MTPKDVKYIRNAVMVAEEKDKDWIYNFLKDRDFEFICTLDKQLNPYMSLADLKLIYQKWEDYYWKGWRKIAAFLSVFVGLPTCYAIFRVFV